MTLYHDSRSNIYRSPLGAAPAGESLRLSILATQARCVTLRLWWQDQEKLYPMVHTGGDMYTCTIELPQTPGLLWYYFIAESENCERWYLGNALDGLGGVGHVSGAEPASYQITVYDPTYRTPDWMKNGLMMQIMVDRFCLVGQKDPGNLPPCSYYHIHWDDNPALMINDDKYGDNVNNDYFGGNLKGVESKLDYLKSLGITIIYFNPIFKARSNHKYNTGDYMQIDPTFGTEADFKHLCRAAEERGIRIILDGVFSHTGSDSLYFNRDGHYGPGGAYNDPDSPYASWYAFKKWPGDYDCWWGFKSLPNVNENDHAYRNFIIHDDDSVIGHWTRAGAEGWRLDVADELPMSFIREIRGRLKSEKADSALIGEVWEDPSNKVAYGEMRCYCLGDTLDSTMNYPLRDAIVDFMVCRRGAEDFVRRVENLRENQPAAFFYAAMNLLGSHDKPRALTVLADMGDLEPPRTQRQPIQMDPECYDRGRRRLIAAWELICALPGMPCLYYGDEAGMTGMADPYCRGTYPWGKEDKRLQSAMQSAMLNRMKHPALRTGELKLIACGSDVVLIERTIRSGQDVFGSPAEDDCQALAVNRAQDSRWIEYRNQAFCVPGESALRIDGKAICTPVPPSNSH